MINEIAASVRAGKCVLFLGAGVHAPAPPGIPWNYPTAIAPPFGGALAQKLADESSYLIDYPNCNPRELPRVAMHYELKPGKGRQALFNKVRAEVEIGKKPSPVLRALAELNFPLIVITNYDSFFERSLPAAKQADIRIYEPNPNANSPRADFGDLTETTPGVCKIHGEGTPIRFSALHGARMERSCPRLLVTKRSSFGRLPRANCWPPCRGTPRRFTALRGARTGRPWPRLLVTKQ
jgi:hypothetical protein